MRLFRLLNLLPLLCGVSCRSERAGLDAKEPSFASIGSQHGTDKTSAAAYEDVSLSSHAYHFLYDKYLGPRRHDELRLLEIGLGCDMIYGPGKSLLVWKEYVPKAYISFLEYDEACAAKWKSRIESGAGGTLYTGDQADPAVLAKIVQTGNRFDMIVDDGGHHANQMISSLELLWPLINPGGFYVVEDIHSNYLPRYIEEDFGKRGTFMRYMKHQLELLLSMGASFELPVGSDAPLMDLLSIDCFAQSCVFVKMASSDAKHQ